jgi:putative ABC transport system permease protein
LTLATTSTRGWNLPLQLSLRELGTHVVRSLVTASAVLFGVGALLVMNSLSRGMEDSNKKLFLQMGGAQILQASPSTAIDHSQQASFSLSPGLRLSDVEVLRQNLPEFDLWVPEMAVGPGQVRSSTGRIRAMGSASVWERFALLGEEISVGQGLSPQAWNAGQPIAVVGPAVAKQVDKVGNGLGSDLIVSGIRVKIAGILKTTSNSDQRSYEVDLPISWYRKTQATGDPPLSLLRAQVKDLGGVAIAQRHLASEFLVLHRGVKDVDLSTNDDLLADSRKSIATMSMVTLLIAVVALLSGGVGILNIQFASLSARVRELGVCKALGARSGLLFQQMLLESVLVSGAGGIVGCLIGIVPSLFLANRLPWTPRLTFGDLLLGVAVSLGLGTLAGLLPAFSAAKLEPVEAMQS